MEVGEEAKMIMQFVLTKDGRGNEAETTEVFSHLTSLRDYLERADPNLIEGSWVTVYQDGVMVAWMLATQALCIY